MGEEPWRIHNVGALNLDTILNQTLIKKEILFKKLDLKLEQRLIICLFHPVNLEKEEMGKQMGEILQAIKELNIQTVIIYPNNDLGSRAIISQIDKYRHLPFIRVFPSLLHNDYISLLNYADVLIGNSSSGIIEAPSLKLPVVNIGSRNKGREHAENVLFVAAKKSNIIKAIKKALYEKEFLNRVRRCKNPYGDGKTADRIIKILTQIKIDKKLLTKKITY
jgi:UDP-hydrolysing UDP-N-acetyl-D-glucosamine 2-epimerase